MCAAPTGMEARHDHRSGINAPCAGCDECIPEVMELDMELRLLILEDKYEPIGPGELQADQENQVTRHGQDRRTHVPSLDTPAPSP